MTTQKVIGLYVIQANDGRFWTDDNGGYLFVSTRMAEKVKQKYAEQTKNCTIKPCTLDDDLAQLCNLYHE